LLATRQSASATVDGGDFAKQRDSAAAR
jgi:hypothetical protein